MTKTTRVRRNRAEIEELLAEFGRSGGTQQAFCRERGLSVATFSNWRRKAAQAAPAVGTLRPVRLADASGASGVSVRLPDGLEVFFPAGSGCAEIAGVVAALSGGARC